MKWGDEGLQEAIRNISCFILYYWLVTSYFPIVTFHSTSCVFSVVSMFNHLARFVKIIMSISVVGLSSLHDQLNRFIVIPL